MTDSTTSAVALLKQPGKLDQADLKLVFLLELEINRLRGLLDEAGIDWDITGDVP